MTESFDLPQGATPDENSRGKVSLFKNQQNWVSYQLRKIYWRFLERLYHHINL